MGYVSTLLLIIALPSAMTDRVSDFADQYPNAEVVGTDISPIQPTWIPANLKL